MPYFDTVGIRVPKFFVSLSIPVHCHHSFRPVSLLLYLCVFIRQAKAAFVLSQFFILSANKDIRLEDFTYVHSAIQSIRRYLVFVCEHIINKTVDYCQIEMMDFFSAIFPLNTYCLLHSAFQL